MRCPYLSSASNKECVKMLEMNIEGDLSDFDLKRFCGGNPVYCYYFRLPALEAVERISKPEHSLKPLPKDIPLPAAFCKHLSAKVEKDSWED